MILSYLIWAIIGVLVGVGFNLIFKNLSARTYGLAGASVTMLVMVATMPFVL